MTEDGRQAVMDVATQVYIKERQKKKLPITNPISFSVGNQKEGNKQKKNSHDKPSRQTERKKGKLVRPGREHRYLSTRRSYDSRRQLQAATRHQDTQLPLLPESSKSLDCWCLRAGSCMYPYRRPSPGLSITRVPRKVVTA